MINISSNTLEAMIEGLQDMLSHQEAEARTQIPNNVEAIEAKTKRWMN
jgi:hypothetical protein